MVSDNARKKLVELRKTRKLTQADVAKILGYETSKGYYELESGKTSLKVEHIEKLSNYFNVTPAYFFD